MAKKTTPKTKAEPRFEVALSRLEKIAERLESGDLQLEDALRQYEEGVGLARFCSEKLTEVQKRVELLKKDGEAWTRTPYSQDEDADER